MCIYIYIHTSIHISIFEINLGYTTNKHTFTNYTANHTSYNLAEVRAKVKLSENI